MASFVASTICAEPLAQASPMRAAANTQRDAATNAQAPGAVAHPASAATSRTEPSPEWRARYVRPCAKSGGRLIC